MSQVNLWLRKKQKVIIVALCSLLMVTFVGGSAFISALSRESRSGGKVFNQSVSSDELMVMTNGILLLSNGRLQGKLAEAKAWELILLNREAERFGINVSRSEIQDSLKSRFPNQAGDGISLKDYNEFLARFRTTSTAYEEALKAILAAGQLQEFVLRNVSLPTPEAWLWYSRENHTLKVRYVMLRAQDLAPLVQLKDDEIKDFYLKYTDSFDEASAAGPSYRDPEKIQMEYVMAPFGKYAKDVQVTRKQIEEYYEKHKQDYLIPEKKEDKKPEEDKAAEKKPAAPKLAPKYKPLDQVREEIGKAIRDEAGQREAEKAINQANEEIYRIIEALPEDSASAAVDMKALAERLGLDYRRTKYFSQAEINSILPGAFALAQQAFGKGMREIGYPKSPMKADEGFFIYQILQSRPPRPSPFAEVKEQVEKDLRLVRALKLADTVALEAMNSEDIQGAEKQVAEKIAELAKSAGIKPETEKEKKAWFLAGESKFFTRPKLQRSYFQRGATMRVQYETGLPGYGNYARFADKAFAVAPEKVGVVVDGGAAILFQRIGSQAEQREEFDKKADVVTWELLEKKRAVVIADWRREMIQRALPSSSVLNSLVLLPDWQNAMLKISD